MVLTDVLNNDAQLKVVSYGNSQQAKALQRLHDLGISIGRVIVLLQRLPFGGPLVIQSGQSVFSISQDIAQYVCVEKVPATEVA